jgi:hypothetical protein
MLLMIALILGVLWVLGFVVLHVASGAIHLLVVAAVAALIFHLVRGTSGTTRGLNL